MQFSVPIYKTSHHTNHFFARRARLKNEGTRVKWLTGPLEATLSNSLHFRYINWLPPMLMYGIPNYYKLFWHISYSAFTYTFLQTKQGNKRYVKSLKNKGKSNNWNWVAMADCHEWEWKRNNIVWTLSLKNRNISDILKCSGDLRWCKVL